MTEEARLYPELKRVLWGLTPYPDESLLGFVARTADHNVLETTFAITGQVGQVYGHRANCGISPVHRQTELAHILRVETGEVLKRSYFDPNGELLRNFFGVNLRQTDVDAKVRRFSPDSLRKAPYQRAVWECRLLPFCPDSWDILQEECHLCHAKQQWRSANGVAHCDSCSADLRDVPTTKVDPEDRPNLDWFAAFFSPLKHVQERAKSSLPPSLAHLSPTLFVALAIRLLAVVDPWVKKAVLNGWQRDTSRYLRTLVAVLGMLRTWPVGFHEHVRRLHVATSSDWRKSSVKTCNRFLKNLIAHEEPAVRSVGEIAILHLRTHQDHAPSTIIGLNDAIGLMGGSASLLKACRRKNLLRATLSLQNGQLTQCLDRAEITFLSEFARSRISAEAFATRFGMTYHGVEQLICLGVLEPVSHPWIEANYGSQQFQRDAIEQFEKALLSASNSSLLDADCQALPECLRSIGGRLRPWGPIVAALLSGDIPYTIEGEGKTFASRIRIRRADRARLAELTFDRHAHTEYEFEPGVSMLDAAANLNVSAPKATFLGPLQRPGSFAHKYRNIPMTAVEELAMRVVSAPELLALTGQKLSELTAELSRAGFNRIHPMGWDRACLTSLIGP